ncbi:MAG: hypothetical protein ACI9OJ_000855 [Myxococcota bacterium]
MGLPKWGAQRLSTHLDGQVVPRPQWGPGGGDASSLGVERADCFELHSTHGVAREAIELPK